MRFLCCTLLTPKVWKNLNVLEGELNACGGDGFERTLLERLFDSTVLVL